MASNSANNGADSADIDPIYQNLDWYVYPTPDCHSEGVSTAQHTVLHSRFRLIVIRSGPHLQLRL